MNWMPTRVEPSSPASAEEDDVAIERHVQPLQHQHHHQRRDRRCPCRRRCRGRRHSRRARGAERRMCPLRGVDVDDVGVAHDEQRPLAAVALQAARQRSAESPVRSANVWRKCGECRAPLLQHLTQRVQRSGPAGFSSAAGGSLACSTSALSVREVAPDCLFDRMPSPWRFAAGVGQLQPSSYSIRSSSHENRVTIVAAIRTHLLHRCGSELARRQLERRHSAARQSQSGDPSLAQARTARRMPIKCPDPTELSTRSITARRALHLAAVSRPRSGGSLARTSDRERPNHWRCWYRCRVPGCTLRDPWKDCNAP